MINGNARPTTALLDEVEVVGGHDGFKQRVKAGRHTLVADEPVAAGGDDAGPGPYDFVLIGLGACTSITLSAYARQRHWPLEAVIVRLYRENAGHVRRELQLYGPLSEEQRGRLFEIAERCPVHRSLSAGMRIQTRLAEIERALPA